MENLDIEGLFWKAANPDDKVAGRLRFDSDDGARLNLIGAFFDRPSPGTNYSRVSFNQNERIRIQGAAGGRLVTLDRSLKVGDSYEVPGTIREKYIAPIVLSDHHFDVDESLDFSSVSVCLRHSAHWVRRSEIIVKCEQEESSDRVRLLSIELSPPEKSVVQTHIGQLELSYGCQIVGDHIVESTIKQDCGFIIRFTDPLSLERAVDYCAALRDLMTIGLETPSSPTEITLTLPQSGKGVLEKEKVTKRVRLYADLKGSRYLKEKKAPHPFEMAFTFDDIGELNGVANWLELADRYRVVIGFLMNCWYEPGMSVENRFANTTIAAEALARIRVGKQKIKFNKALETLADFAGQPFKDLVGDTNSWVTKVVKTRNNHVIHTGLRGSVDASGLYWLSESLYFLVILCLLRECGIAENTLANIGKHQRFRRVTSELQALI